MATADTTRARTFDAPRTSGRLSRLATETKASIKTSELYAYIAAVVMVLIAANAIEGEEGGVDFYNARHAWLYVTILTVGYMISRGLAKSGSRDPYWRESGDNRNDDDR